MRCDCCCAATPDYVWNLAWSPDSRALASASSDHTVRLVSAQDAKVLAVLRGHTDTVWGVTWSPSGTQLATSSTDGSAIVWDLRPRGAEVVAADGHRGPVNQASWSARRAVDRHGLRRRDRMPLVLQ
ncbi:WD40 repeat domain-containing protein [Kitasatospora cinereorecta]